MPVSVSSTSIGLVSSTSTSSTEETAVLVKNFPITDTNTHTYRTDPSYFYLVSMPSVSAYAIWIYNSTNQMINVQVIGNLTNDQTYPDYTIGSAYTVASGGTNMYVLAEDTALTPFVSLSISANTAPTSGAVYAVVITE